MVSAASSSVPPPSSSRTSPLHLTSSEINILIHCYLLESNLVHSAFTFSLETKLASLPEVGNKIPRGELLRWLHRGLAWQEVEAHVGEDGPLPPCSSPFTLLAPHVCDPIPPSTPSPSSSRIPLPSTQQLTTLSIASTSSTVPPPPPRPELFPEPSPADDTTTVAVGSSSAKGKRKAVNGSGEKHGDGDSENGSVGEKSGGGKKDEVGSTSKRARVEKEKKEDIDVEGRKAQAKASKAATKPLPLPSFQRKSTSTNSSNPPRPTSSSSSTTSSKPASPSTTLHSLPITSSNLNSTFNNHSSSSTTAGTSSKKSNSTTTSPILSSNRTLASSSTTTTTGTSQKKKKPSSTTSTSTIQASSSSAPPFVDRAPGIDYTKTIRTVSLSFEASPDGTSSSEEGEGSTSASASTSEAGKSSVLVLKGKSGKGGKGKDAKGSGKGKGKVRIFGGEHNGEVFVCKFSPVKQSGGGEVLATGAGDATVRLWEFQPPGAPGSTDPEGWSMDESPTICKHLPVTDRKDITSIDFNPPGTLIGTASYDGIARLWTPEGELHGVLTRHSGAIFCLKFNPTGSLLATAGSDGSVCVWEADSARLRQAYEFHLDCTLDVDWLDDDTLASCSMDKTITICRVGSSTPYRTFRGHTDEVNRVAWSPAPPSSSDVKPSSSSFGFGSSASASSSSAGRVLASCSDDATVRIWGLDVEPSTASDDGGFQNGRLEKYCKGVLRGHDKEIYTFAFAPTSVGSSSSIPILATASFDQTVRLWDISSLSCLRVLRAHTETVFSISFSPSGRHLASAGWDKLMVVWETETGKPVRHRAGEAGIFELEWSKNAGVVAVCQSDKSVVMVDVKELE
ncbi:WD40-repeat-containing domain protein [Mrakia frigida]|uniref:WD40 repeat domain-containing protein n=1 Tax=Mrakia frigida TaxID=29902 RepID=UPI003FCBFE15